MLLSKQVIQQTARLSVNASGGSKGPYMELEVTSGKKDVRILKTLAAVSRLVSLSVALCSFVVEMCCCGKGGESLLVWGLPWVL